MVSPVSRSSVICSAVSPTIRRDAGEEGGEEEDRRSENKENKRLGLCGGRSSPTSDKRKITIVEGKNLII